MSAAPQRGEIYFLSFGDGKERPVAIISRDSLNGGDNVVVVPFTTARIDERRTQNGYVHFKAGECGLPKECVAKSDEITLIPKINIDFTRKVGRLTGDRMQQIVDAVRWVIRDSSLSPQSVAPPHGAPPTKK